MGKVQKSELSEFLLGVTQHFLIRRVSGQKAAVEICEGDTDGRILKYRTPPLFACAKRFLRPRALEDVILQPSFGIFQYFNRSPVVLTKQGSKNSAACNRDEVGDDREIIAPIEVHPLRLEVIQYNVMKSGED
jgi:hypothetical protein